MDDNGDDKIPVKTNMFNEERIRAWRKQRMSLAETAAKERKEKAQAERELRAEAFKRQRQEEINNLEIEKKTVALDKLSSFEKINETRQDILIEHNRRRRLFFKKIMLLILAALVLTAIINYFTTPLYEAESIVTIKTNTANDNVSGSSLLPTSVSPNLLQYIFSAREYIFSREMMDRMEKGKGFISYFKKNDIHFLSRPFSSRLTGRDDYSYYKRRVKVAIDIQEGLLRIKVQAKNQKDAKHFAEALLRYAERWVNSLSERMYKEKINEAEKSLAKTEKKLQIARKRIVNFQISKRDLNPKETVAAIYKNLNDIKIKTKQAEREIAVYKKAQVNNSPVVERLRAHLTVLRQQHKSLNARLIDKGDQSMNKILSGFESALIERDFAEKEWEVALKSLENIKLEVFNQRQYFLTIVPPISSPLPVEPQQLKTYLLLFFMLYGLVALCSLIKTTLKISLHT